MMFRFTTFINNNKEFTSDKKWSRSLFPLERGISKENEITAFNETAL